jgi:hypothetical protein
MSDNPATAMRAFRGERVDRALEAVECMRFAGEDDLKRIVVVVAADFTLGHEKSPVD